jgi:hypothetical protein
LGGPQNWPGQQEEKILVLREYKISPVGLNADTLLVWNAWPLEVRRYLEEKVAALV